MLTQCPLGDKSHLEPLWVFRGLESTTFPKVIFHSEQSGVLVEDEKGGTPDSDLKNFHLSAQAEESGGRSETVSSTDIPCICC